MKKTTIYVQAAADGDRMFNHYYKKGQSFYFAKTPVEMPETKRGVLLGVELGVTPENIEILPLPKFTEKGVTNFPVNEVLEVKNLNIATKKGKGKK